MGIVIFNNVSSADYGILVEHPPGYQIPQRDYETVHIPGRNGDLVIDMDSYQNVEREYQIAIGSLQEQFVTMANRISEWLNSANGYARLEDSYEPEYYRMALYQEQVNVENILFHAGRATINFNCKPQRFLKSGEETITIDSQTILRNPTNFKAAPIIKVYGTGTGNITIGNYGVRIIEFTDHIIIDSTMMDIYTIGNGNQKVNANGQVELSVDGYPRLLKGDNYIGFTGDIVKLEVIPNWWTI